MILNFTDAEAMALLQQLRANAGTIGNTTEIEEGLGEGTSAVNVEALGSAKAQLQRAMQKSDAKLSLSLDYAISSLESSGFDSDQLEALRGAKEKAARHNDKKLFFSVFIGANKFY